ncbi:hypothetical protein OESDEN_08191, partial [Oesophagostomum dentatum]
LEAKCTELECIRKEKEDAIVEKQAAGSQVLALKTQLQELEQKLAASDQAKEAENNKKIHEYETQSAKLNADLSEVKQKHDELTRELALNVEDLSRTKAELDKSAARAKESVFASFFSKLR